MLPVLFRFTFESLPAQLVLYAIALAFIGYAAYSGWLGAALDASKSDRLGRAAFYGGIAAVLAKFGLNYALPKSAPIFGGQGDGLPLHTYGLMIALGFVSAVGVAAALAEREWRGEEGKKKREQIHELVFWVLLGGIGGSKLLFLLVNWQETLAHLGQAFSNPAALVASLGGGFVFYGGLLGAMGLAYWFARKNDIDFLRLSDLCIPTVSLGQCFGRLGCFSAGCCWGDVTRSSFRFGVNFPGAQVAKDLFGRLSHTASLVFQSQAADDRWVIESTGQVFHHPVAGAVRISDWVMAHGHTLPVHPTQLYESIGQFFMFAGLLFLRRYRRFHGQILAIWLMGYAVLRSTVELFRGDLERGTLHGLLSSIGADGLASGVPAEAWYNLSTSQFISICMFAGGLWLLLRRGSRVVAPVQAATA
jgi:phosphatidylglycerol:prolipoprotein diacylglycerol transferase